MSTHVLWAVGIDECDLFLSPIGHFPINLVSNWLVVHIFVRFVCIYIFLKGFPISVAITT